MEFVLLWSILVFVILFAELFAEMVFITIKIILYGSLKVGEFVFYLSGVLSIWMNQVFNKVG